MVGTFNQVILKGFSFDHVMFVFAAKNTLPKYI